MTSNQYAVIEFDDGVSFAPEKWLTPRKTHCYWPPYKNQTRLSRAIENQEDTAENWSLYNIKKLLCLTSMIISYILIILCQCICEKDSARFISIVFRKHETCQRKDFTGFNNV